MTKTNRILTLLAAVLFWLVPGLRAQMPEGKTRTPQPTPGGDKTAVVDRATRRHTLAAARKARPPSLESIRTN